MNYSFHRTHNEFFKAITENQLRELYRRADDNNKILENDINKILSNAYCHVHVNNNCHIFINYYDNNHKKIGHISLHIDKEDKYLPQHSKEYGRFHIANNKQKSSKYTLKLNRKSNINQTNKSSLYFSYDKTLHMRKELKTVIDPTIKLLESYFNETSSNALKKYNKTYKSKCLSHIKSKISLRTTPKAKQYINSI